MDVTTQKPVEKKQKVSPVIKQMIDTVCERLGEKSPHAKFQIMLLFEYLGPKEVLKLFQETLQIFEGPGMFTLDGTKKRTAGGILFRLAKERYHGTLPANFYYAPKPKKNTAPLQEGKPQGAEKPFQKKPTVGRRV